VSALRRKFVRSSSWRSKRALVFGRT
jgi:hypothetical protein